MTGEGIGKDLIEEIEIDFGESVNRIRRL